MIGNVSAAARLVQRVVSKRHLCLYSKVSVNRFGHFLLMPLSKSMPSYYGVFKREWFMSFGDWFPVFLRLHPEFAGIGESINEGFLKTALARKSTLLCFVHVDGEVYVVDPRVVAGFCLKHGLVRVQYGGERTYCVPVRLLCNIYDGVAKTI